MEREPRPRMRLLMVGGQCRNVGKTALVVDVIRAFPEASWVAVKITQHGHGSFSVPDKPCRCAADVDNVALEVETDKGGRSDTSRFLAAGARRALWLRTRPGQIGRGWPFLLAELDKEELGESLNVIVESNSLLEVAKADLYLTVLDPSVDDFKDSAAKFLNLADAFVVRKRIEGKEGMPKASLDPRPAFRHEIGEALPLEAVAWIRRGFFGARSTGK